MGYLAPPRRPAITDRRSDAGKADGPISLRRMTPLRGGNNRLLYPHPACPEYLIKVMRPEIIESRRKPRRLYQRLKRERILGSFVREIREQLILAGHGEDAKQFLQQIVGFCETDLGVGMVVRAVRGRDGKLAPNLRQAIVRDGFDDDKRRAFERFREVLLDSRIAISGLFLRNVLCGVDDEGRCRLVLVDGFGEGALLRVRGAFPPLNRRAKQKMIDGLRAEVSSAMTKSEG